MRLISQLSKINLFSSNESSSEAVDRTHESHLTCVTCCRRVELAGAEQRVVVCRQGQNVHPPCVGVAAEQGRVARADTWDGPGVLTWRSGCLSVCSDSSGTTTISPGRRGSHGRGGLFWLPECPSSWTRIAAAALFFLSPYRVQIR